MTRMQARLIPVCALLVRNSRMQFRGRLRLGLAPALRLALLAQSQRNRCPSSHYPYALFGLSVPFSDYPYPYSMTGTLIRSTGDLSPVAVPLECVRCGWLALLCVSSLPLPFHLSTALFAVPTRQQRVLRALQYRGGTLSTAAPTAVPRALS